jgi:hypothetical protein
MTRLEVAKAKCANSDISGEEYLARKYCEPKTYWHCTHGLSGSSHYTFAEINYPQNWPKVVAKYTQQGPSGAAKQLHRRVEAARADFKRKQEKAWGAGGVDRAIFDKKELAAWDTFNAQKQAYLRDYLKAIATGVVRRKRTGRNCKQCNTAKVIGRARYCDSCTKQRQRDSLRASRNRKRQKRFLGDISSFSGAVQPEAFTKAKNSKNSPLATTIAEGAEYGFKFTDKDAALAKLKEVAK